MGDLVQLLLAGGVGGIISAVALYIRARGQNRIEAKSQQDEYAIKFRAALDADEETFRKSLWEMIASVRQELADEKAARRDLDTRLTTTQNELTKVTLERDMFKRQLDEAHQKIRHMEVEIAQLRAQQGGS